ncbi:MULTISPECIES: aldehyde dehydrogenase [unclassified Sporosarcina]|uniref:aldehyde dehydrogenase family protein n=1 Tax=unclassified Sporosarcina TaxID=2647733 RepID=UPI001E46940A|nr:MULTISPECIES: aldehyde dehydrogenase family protein [unclassified Sporosarcina]
MVYKTEATLQISGKILVNGEWKTLNRHKDVINPAVTSEVVGFIGLASEEDVDRAITAAADAYPTWSQTSLDERIERVHQVWERVKDRVDEYTTLFVRENGKTLQEGKLDIQRCVQILNELPENLKNWYEPRDLSGQAQQVEIRRRPRGVTAIITPWNSPMILTFKRVIPAILTGNTVVFKPATDCPLTIMVFMKELADCLPPGVLNVVTGSGGLIGDRIAKDERVRTIAFVGGTNTGKVLMEKSSSTLKKLNMELGGNDPAIILADADLNKETILKLRNGVLKGAGQVCSAIKRIYVHETRYEELLDKLSEEFNKTIVGNGIQPDVKMGPLNNESQFRFVKDLIDRAEKEGAKVHYFGRKLNEDTWEDGYFMLPAIVTNVHQESEIMRAEQFGPVIPVMSFNDTEQVIKYANDSEYGLRASIWTTDIEAAKRLADRIEAGAIFFNNHTIFKDLRLDFPGIKESGLSSVTEFGGFEHFTDSYGFAE